MPFTDKELSALRQTAEEARLARLVELAARGANHDVKHPDRKEWEMLRDLLFANAA